MLHLYDECITNDLVRSFNPENVPDPIVKVVGPDGIIDLVAQIKEDEISFPVVALDRVPDISIDTSRTNFTRLHKGVHSVIDPATNELYYEKAIPVNLSYKLSVLTTNTVDMEELVKELLFKYSQMYFLSLTLPYECNRKVRFGIVVDPSSPIQRNSGTVEYIQSGKLHESVISLNCEGCVLVSYTAAKLRRMVYEIQPTLLN